jgi:pimeloyl-ACP methyl ester carboxylesterase
MTTATSVRVRDGLELPIYSSGSGRPLLVVPGIANDPLLTWEPARPHFEPHVAFTAVHRRGALGDPSTPLTMEEEFDDIAEVANTLGAEVDLLGHSSGALYALGAAPKIPNLRKLVLYEPPFEAHMNSEYRRRRAVLEGHLQTGDIDALFHDWWAVYLGIPEEIAGMIMQSPMGTTLRPMAQHMPREIRAHLDWNAPLDSFSAVTVPTLYLLGEENANNPQFKAWSALLGLVMPNLQIRQIPGQGHFAPILDPAGFAEIVVRFLAE